MADFIPTVHCEFDPTDFLVFISQQIIIILVSEVVVRLQTDGIDF